MNPLSKSQISFARLLYANVLSEIGLELAGATLVTAHGCFESGYGIGAAARAGWNVFNLTAGPAWKGVPLTREQAEALRALIESGAEPPVELDELLAQFRVRGGKWVHPGGDTDAKGQKITQTWRAYPSLSSAVRDYWEFLGPTRNGGRYTLARTMLTVGNLRMAAKELHTAGYFELAPDVYAQRLDAVALAISPHLHTPKEPPNA